MLLGTVSVPVRIFLVPFLWRESSQWRAYSRERCPARDCTQIFCIICRIHNDGQFVYVDELGRISVAKFFFPYIFFESDGDVTHQLLIHITFRTTRVEQSESEQMEQYW